MLEPSKPMATDVITASAKYLGLKEVPGHATNPFIADWYKLVKLGGSDDSKVPWCAVFVAGVLNECGILGTGSGMARSYLHWGSSVLQDEPVPGDICVFKRGDNAIEGHVGFFLRYSANNKSVWIRSGNVNNSVCDEPFSTDRLIDIRRMVKPFFV